MKNFKLNGIVNLYNNYILTNEHKGFKCGEVVCSHSPNDAQELFVCSLVGHRFKWLHRSNLLALTNLFQQQEEENYWAVGVKSLKLKNEPYWIASIAPITFSLLTPFKFQSLGECLFFITYISPYSTEDLIFIQQLNNYDRFNT